MWPDWVSNLGPLALESDALPTALRARLNIDAYTHHAPPQIDLAPRL